MLNPLPPARWGFESAAHLANRAGLGGTPPEIQRLVELGPERAVSHYVDYESIPDPVSAPTWARPDPDLAARLAEQRRLGEQLRQAGEADRKALEQKRQELQRTERQDQQRHLGELRQWWLERMRTTPRPLQEKLVLFWHGHFATGVVKVRNVFYLWQQNEVFRQHALGPWLELLTAVSRDPAMLIWLDLAQSRRDHPNENFARELMELFTLGEGHYSERDVTEAARALTGWSLNRPEQRFQWRPMLHDPGEKSVLGQTGRWNGEDILRILVAQPQAARFLCRKLWVFFASEDPDPTDIEALATVFRRSQGDLRPVLRVMFQSEAFYAPAVMRSQVKSPVQWLVSTLRWLERDLPPQPFPALALRQMGQDLFAPPNVKGWDGGTAWITTNTLVTRYNLATTLVLGQAAAPAPNGGTRGPERRLARPGVGPRREPPTPVSALVAPEGDREAGSLLASLQRRFLQAPLREKQATALRAYLDSQKELTDDVVRHAIRLMLCSPDFQMT